MKMQTRWTKTWSPAEALGAGAARAKTGLTPMPSLVTGLCDLRRARLAVAA